MKLLLMVWNGKQYVKNTVEYDFDSMMVFNNHLQIFIREKPKTEDNTGKEKQK